MTFGPVTTGDPKTDHSIFDIYRILNWLKDMIEKVKKSFDPSKINHALLSNLNSTDIRHLTDAQLAGLHIAGTDKQVIYNDNGVAAGANVFYDKATGNLGVGIDPDYLLHLASDVPVFTLEGTTLGQESIASMWVGYNGNFFIMADASNVLDDSTLAFGVDGYLTMALSSLGYLGIGVNPPTQRLDVAGAIKSNTLTDGKMLKSVGGVISDATNTDTQIAAAVTASHARSHALDSTSDHSVGSLSASTVPKVKADGTKLEDSAIKEVGGNVGIGISPLSLLHTNSGSGNENAIEMSSSYGSGPDWKIRVPANSYDLQCYNKRLDTIIYTILGSGSNQGFIGFGTTTPTEKIDVLGNIKASGLASSNAAFKGNPQSDSTGLLSVNEYDKKIIKTLVDDESIAIVAGLVTGTLELHYNYDENSSDYSLISLFASSASQTISIEIDHTASTIVATDTDNKFCVFASGGSIYIKNRLGTNVTFTAYLRSSPVAAV